MASASFPTGLKLTESRDLTGTEVAGSLHCTVTLSQTVPRRRQEDGQGGREERAGARCGTRSESLPQCLLGRDEQKLISARSGEGQAGSLAGIGL